MKVGSRLKNINEENNFFYLTLALIALLVSGALAEVVVYLEAIVGVFYMAIVVSSLVSANLQHREQQNG